MCSDMPSRLVSSPLLILLPWCLYFLCLMLHNPLISTSCPLCSPPKILIFSKEKSLMDLITNISPQRSRRSNRPKIRNRRLKYSHKLLLPHLRSRRTLQKIGERTWSEDSLDTRYENSSFHAISSNYLVSPKPDGNMACGAQSFWPIQFRCQHMDENSCGTNPSPSPQQNRTYSIIPILGI